MLSPEEEEEDPTTFFLSILLIDDGKVEPVKHQDLIDVEEYRFLLIQTH